MWEEYFIQSSEEIEARVAKNSSQLMNRTDSRILGAFSKLDEFFLNSQARYPFPRPPGSQLERTRERMKN